MKSCPIIDFHTHAFPDHLAARTIDKLISISGCTASTDGSIAGLADYLHQNQFKHGVLLQIATRPNQYETVNNWAADMHATYPNILAFGSIHPDDGEKGIQELKRFAKLGLKGVKFHPDYQNFFVDESRMFSIYKACGELGLPILFHAGWDPLSPDIIHATPKRIAQVVKQFPKTTFIAAHLAGMQDVAETKKHLVGLPLYLDLSMALTYLPDETIQEVITRHGADRILFATDCPWGDAERYVDTLYRLHLTDDERTNIFYQNAAKILKLED